MPEPGKDEKEKDFISRCIPIVLEEGTAEDNKQAAAMCYSLWRKAKGEKEPKSLDPDAIITFGGEVKALGDGRLGGYLIRYSTEDDTDLEDDFFDAETDYGSAMQSDTYYNHGLDAKLGRKMLGVAPLKSDDVGIWIELQLKLRDKWERAVYALAEKGKLGWSSGTAPHLVEREAKGSAWHITRWPLGLDASLTPTPAEPRNGALPLKSWADTMTVTNAGLKVVTQEDEIESSSVSTTAGDVVVNVTVNQKAKETPKSTEVLTMSEKEEVQTQEAPNKAAPALDVESIIKSAVDEARKAFQAETAGPIKTPGVVVEDEADRAAKGNPFRFGEFLMAVKDSGMGIVDKRLLPVRSEDGFNMTKALGQNLVGSLYHQHYLKNWGVKQTGLAEGTGALGGFLVDTDHRMDIMGRVYDIGQLLQRVSMFRVSANSNAMTFNADAETSRVDGSRHGGVRGYWLAEAATKTASYPTFRQIELKLKKCAALVYATDELLADTAALESYIMRIMPEELSFIVEDAIVNGTGVGMPLGILASGCLISVAKETGQAAATIVAENVNKMWSRMWGPSRRNAVWLYNQDCEPQLRLMAIPVGTGGAPVYLPPGGFSAAPYGTIFGRPCVPVEYCATLGTQGDIILADLGEYYMIEKGGVEAASSIHVQFVYDETVFRFVWRVDGQPAWASTLTPFKGTNTLSPFVVLDARA